MRKKQISNLILKISVVVLIVLLLGVFYKNRHQPTIKEVKTIAVGYKKMNVGVISTGIIEPMKQVKVKAEIGGILRDVRWEKGAVVKKGVLWGKIDTPEINQHLQNIEKLKAELKQMDIDYQNALKRYTRLKELYLQGAVSKEMVEEAEVTCNKTSISFQLLKQQLNAEKGRKDLLAKKSIITFPISGIILKQDVEEGVVVTPGSELFTIAKLDKLRVKCQLPEIDVAKVKKDMMAEITIENLPQEKFYGKIIEVSPFPIKESNLLLFEVFISISNSSPKLQIGRSVNVEIFSTQEEKSLTIPIEAVSIKENKKFVFVVKNEMLYEREVKTGTIDIEGENIEIISGLKEGEEICISVDEELKEGMKVKAIKVPKERR